MKRPAKLTPGAVNRLLDALESIASGESRHSRRGTKANPLVEASEVEALRRTARSALIVAGCRENKTH